MIRVALWGLAVWGFVLHGPSASAQEPSGRFLIIADTSSAMKRYAPATQKALSNLLLSSMHGQLSRGDTIGLWTFNDELFAGRFPLQHWTPETTELVASNVVAFIRAQPYEKQSQFDTVWPALRRLISESARLTVLLVSDGNEQIAGTPFDFQINGVFKEYFKAQRKARMPFITILRAQQGQLVGCAINLAPWPVEFPTFPPLPEIAEGSHPKPVAPPKKKEVKSSVPPLIIIGKKPETPSATKPAAESTPPPASVAIPSARESTKPAAAPSPVAVKQTETAKPAPNQPVQPTPTLKPTETPHDAGATPAPSVKTTSTPDVAPPIGPLVSTTVVPQPGTVVVQPKVEALPTTLPKPPETIPTPKAEAVQLKTPAPVESKPVEPIASPPAVSQVESPKPSTVQPGPTKVQPPVKPKEEAAPTELPATAVSTPPVQVAATPAPETGFNVGNALMIGLVVLVVAGVLFLLISRRQRVVSRASLITRSMDRDSK